MTAPTPKPLVSVYITSHNRPEMLKRAIESVRAQSFTNWELLIVDDASQQDVVEVLKYYQELDPRIRYWSNSTRQGANHNRNLAIAQANGTYITGLDDDDYFKPVRLQFFVDNYDPKYAFICDNRDVLERDGSISQSYNDGEQVISLQQILRENICGNQIFVETERLRSIGGFDEQVKKYQDHDTWICLIAKFGPAYRFNKNSYVVDVSHELERISNAQDSYQAHLKLYQKHLALCSAATESYVRLRLISIAKQQGILHLKPKDFLFEPRRAFRCLFS